MSFAEAFMEVKKTNVIRTAESGTSCVAPSVPLTVLLNMARRESAVDGAGDKEIEACVCVKEHNTYMQNNCIVQNKLTY